MSVMSPDAAQAWALVAQAEADPGRSGELLADLGALDVEDPEVQDAAEVLVTMARAVNLAADLTPEEAPDG
jgi:hypothetical protein